METVVSFYLARVKGSPDGKPVAKLPPCPDEVASSNQLINAALLKNVPGKLARQVLSVD